jgi:hypothetical protein
MDKAAQDLYWRMVREAHDLDAHDPDGTNTSPEYERGIVELICRVCGIGSEEMEREMVMADIARGRPLWNVAVPVVDLVAADSAAEAIGVLSDRVTAAGLDVYEGALPHGAHAFRSET